MATHVTRKQFSDVFNQIKAMTKNLPHTNEKLVELQETTDAVFKANQDRSRLYKGIKKAIKTISKEENLQANIKILLAVAEKTSNSAIKNCALRRVAKVCVKHDDLDEVRNIDDNDKRDLVLFAIVKRAIKTKDLQKAIEIIDEDDITDSGMEEDLCAEIVAKFIEMGLEGDEEIALRAAKKASSNEISANLARLFAEGEKIDSAVEALGQIQDLELSANTLVECTPYVATEEDLETCINFINESENKILLPMMEKFARALIDNKKMAFAMKVVDSLVKGKEDEERVSKTLANICQHFIEKNHTANVVKIADKMVDLMEFYPDQCRVLLLGIIQSLKDHHKSAVATQVQKLLAKL